MNRRRLLLAGLGSLSAAACARVGAVPTTPSPEPSLGGANLTRRERRALESGQLVSRAFSFRNDRGKYIGAVSHVVTLLPPELVLDLIFEIEKIPAWLPFNHGAEIVDGASDDLVVEMRQGVEPFIATFSVAVARRDPTIRWELDASRPHDIADLRGFFTARPWDDDTTLMSTGIAVDLGTGVLRMLEKEIARVIPDATADAQLYLHDHPRRFERSGRDAGICAPVVTH